MKFLLGIVVVIGALAFSGLSLPPTFSPPVAYAALPPPSGALSARPLNPNFSAGLSNWTSSGMTWQPSVSVPATNASMGTNGLCVGMSIPAQTTAGVASALGTSTLTSSPFTVPADGSRLALGFFVPPIVGGAGVIGSILLESEGYATSHGLFNIQFGTAAVLTSCDTTAWAGQNAEVKFQTASLGGVVFLNGGAPISVQSERNDPRSPDPVSFTSGAFFQTHTDISIPGRGTPLEFTRTYSSAGAQTTGSLGWGWTTNYDAKLSLASDGSALAQYPDGTHVMFTKSGGVFTPSQGVADSLVQVGSTFTLTTSSQVRMNFDATGRLASFQDRNSNTTTLTYPTNSMTVTDPGGRHLFFTLDPTTHLITQMHDELTPVNRMFSYSYDASGNLQTVTYPVDDVTTAQTIFAYDNRRMTTITNGLTKVQVTNWYDSADRVMEQDDAVGGVTCFYYGSGPANSRTNCPGVTPVAVAGQTFMVDARGNKQLH